MPAAVGLGSRPLERAVGAAVVDHDNFVIEVQLLHHIKNRFAKWIDAVLLVVDGSDDGHGADIQRKLP